MGDIEYIVTLLVGRKYFVVVVVREYLRSGENGE